MTAPLILASGSTIRAALLRNAGVPFEVQAARVDEDAVKDALRGEAASPRDVADALAELKAAKISGRRPEALVLGCDQVLAFDGGLLSKPRDPEEALAQLSAMRGKVHQLLSAAVLYEGGAPQWRHVGVVRLHMRDASDAFLEDYVARNWDEIRHCVGAYQIEAEGVRLFHRIEGSLFDVQGLPLLELLSYLTLRGTLPA
ncbi:septum formation protein Maf [Salipiger sp. IMCC34102]|uniref:Maf family protein n=1 Tax=Salipiger sp. IMCC34102 TaxID=2510647 RepID=UPI00101CBC4D|nr:nucleoside triphosphate pyrophosphatase [Salipiger sp. IMCC34102]RYH04218.1 septum formation protein Maf [Salipiger sp. IMCC34102]